VDALILSYALDTNGQNARYVRAAERWGSDPGVLRALAVGNYDPANVVGRYGLAAEKIGGVAIRSAHRSQAYFDFPRDLIWDRSTDAEVRRLAAEADVIHLNNNWRSYQSLGLRKPALLHHHGSMFRSNPEPLLGAAKARGFAQAVSTIDLLRIAPDVLTWLPTAYDLDELAEIGRLWRREPDGRFRVVSAPTNRAFKSTEALLAAVEVLQGEGLPIDLLLVEGKTWAECLRAKATADLYFDQVILGYGCNAVEAWGMDVPVVAGADPWTLDRMRAEFGVLPFYEATPETIADAIRTLYASPDLRAEYVARGKAHNARYHAERPALERLVELYGRAIQDRQAIISAPRIAPPRGGSWAGLAQARREARIAARRGGA